MKRQKAGAAVRCCLVALAVVGVPLAARPLPAQQITSLRVGLGAPGPKVGDRPDPLAHFLPESRTFWKEGGIILGGLTAIVGLAFLLDPGESGEGAGPWYAVPPVAAISFLVGFSPGALLGSLIPKAVPEAGGG